LTIIVLTGAPGVGKTTVVIHVAQALKGRGVKVGGVVSRELRTNNMTDLASNDRNVLASIAGNGPRVGKYFVNLAGSLLS
jgi:nucleoside-triphosphatase